ncbi:hypothetical protein PV325_000375, partial [Microctonus aethiopoides]
LKLATQLLRPGGCFVTKVFRSKEYDALMWVLMQLFKKVNPKKPDASRPSSSETYLVCQFYLAPDKLDPKFFDPNYVFSQLDIEPSYKLNVFHPDIKKKSKMSVSDFIAHHDGITALHFISEIDIDNEKIANHPLTTKEIVECCGYIIGENNELSLDSDYDMNEFENTSKKSKKNTNTKEIKKSGGTNGFEVVSKEATTKPF